MRAALLIAARQAERPGREARPPRAVAIFVPPPVLQEVQAVFQPPMMADVLQQLCRRDTIGIETGNEVAHVVR